MIFYPTDRVIWTSPEGIEYHGEVTVVREHDCKVMFDYDEDRQPEYWYYLKSELKLEERNDMLSNRL